MASRFDILDTALRLVGAGDGLQVEEGESGEAVRGLTTDSQSAISAYDFLVRPMMLHAHPWSWAIDRVPLAVAADSPPRGSGRRTKFIIPEGRANAMRALYVHETDEEPRTSGWTRRGAFLYGDFETAWVDVLKDNVAEEQWPDLFTNVVILGLKAELAIPILEDADIERNARRIADLALGEAKRVDGQGQPSPRVKRFSFEIAAVGGANRVDRPEGRIAGY